MIILGIDPGANGALALLNESGGFKLHDIAGSMAGAIAVIRDWHSKYKIDGVVIEGVGAMPGNAIHNTLKLIEIAKLLEGACMALGIPIIAKPRPADWKKAVGIVLNPPKRPKKPKGYQEIIEPGFVAFVQDGEYEKALESYKQAKARYKRNMDTVSRDRAIELFPKAASMLMRVCDVDRAESLLLAWFGVLKLKGESK